MFTLYPVVDPDLPIRGGGGTGHPDPEMGAGGAVLKKFLFGPKIRGSWAPGPLPWICH